MALTVKTQTNKPATQTSNATKPRAPRLATPPVDPKAAKEKNPAAWDKVPVSPAWSEAVSAYKGSKLDDFSSYAALASLTMNEIAVGISNGFFQKAQAREYIAYKLFGMLGSSEIPELAGLDFRKATNSDSDDVKKLLQRWQKFVTQLTQAGTLVQNLSTVYGTPEKPFDITQDYPNISKDKLRSIFGAWDRACKSNVDKKGEEQPISIAKPTDLPAARKLLKDIYQRGLKARSRQDIDNWYRKAGGAPIEGPADGSSGDALDGGSPSESKRFDKASTVCANIDAGHYKFDEMSAIRAHADAAMAKATKAAKQG